MKPEKFYKKITCEIYCPQLSDPDDWFSGKCEIKIQDRRDGKVVILLDDKEEDQRIMIRNMGGKGDKILG